MGLCFAVFFVDVVALLPARLGKKLPIRIALPAPYVASIDVGTEALLRLYSNMWVRGGRGGGPKNK